MARIVRVEGLMVDLAPKVKRTDAIQSFVSQETPIIRITDADGAVGTGYCYTIGTGGPSVMALIAPLARPGADRPRGRHGRADLARPPLPHPCDDGRRHHLDRAGRDRHGAVGPALPQGRPAAACDGRRRAGRACRSTPPRAAGCTSRRRRSSRMRCAAKAKGFGGCKVKVGRPIHEDVARLAAVREAVGPGFEIFTDANQAFAVDEAIRRARHYEPIDIGWLEEPLAADDIDGHVRLSRSTSLPIAIGESLYRPSHFREYLQRGACSIVQVDVGAHRRHHALAEDGASRRDLQHGGLPAFPDGAARRLVLRRAECALCRVYPAARRHHHRGHGDRGRPRAALAGARPRHRLGFFRDRSPQDPGLGFRPRRAERPTHRRHILPTSHAQTCAGFMLSATPAARPGSPKIQIKCSILPYRCAAAGPHWLRH